MICPGHPKVLITYGWSVIGDNFLLYMYTDLSKQNLRVGGGGGGEMTGVLL